MSDPFFDSRFCLGHAKRRIQEFDAETAAFLDSREDPARMEPNADGSQDVYKVKFGRPFPELRGVAMDALNALRSALDLAGAAAARADGQRGNRAKFPFGDTEGEAKSRRANAKSQSYQVPEKVFDVMMSFEPYKGGKTPNGEGVLWTLNYLINLKKHEQIVPAALHAGSEMFVELTFDSVPSGGGGFGVGFPVWDSTKNEMEVLRVPAGTKPKGYFDFAFLVAFNDAATEGVDARDIFSVMHADVTAAVDAIELKVRELGLI